LNFCVVLFPAKCSVQPFRLPSSAVAQRDRVTRYVSWNLVNCCTTVWEIQFEKACVRKKI